MLIQYEQATNSRFPFTNHADARAECRSCAASRAPAQLFNGSLRLVDIIHVMKPGNECEEFCFNWNWHEGTPPGLHRLLKRHGYNLRSLFNELLALDWQPAKHWKIGAPLDSSWQTFELPEIIVRLPEFGRLTDKPSSGRFRQLQESMLVMEQNLKNVISKVLSLNPTPEQIEVLHRKTGQK